MDSKYNVFSTLLVMLTNMVCIKILVSMAPIEAYSFWNILNTYSSIILIFISLNLIHYFGLSIAKKNLLLSNKLIKLMLFTAMIFSMICGFFLYAINTNYIALILIFALSKYSYNIVRTYMLFSFNMKKFFYYEVFITIFRLIFLMLFIYIDNVLWGIILGMIIPQFLYFIYFVLKVDFIDKEAYYIGHVNVLKICLPLLLNTIFFTLIQNFDKIILQNSGYIDEIAYYSCVLIFFSLSNSLLILINSIMAPHFYSSEGDRRLLLPHIKTYTELFFTFSFVLLIFSDTIIKILYTEEYLVVQEKIPLILLSSIFYYLYTIFNNNLLVKNETRTILSIMIIGFIFNIIFNLTFIPTYSYYAAIFAHCITYLLLFILTIFFVYIRNSSLHVTIIQEIKHIIIHITIFFVLILLINNFYYGTICALILLAIYCMKMKIPTKFYQLLRK